MITVEKAAIVTGPREPFGEVGELALGLGQFLLHPLGVSGQHAPRGGEGDPALGAVDEGEADLAFELRQLLGDGRGREVQRLGRAHDPAAAGHLVQHPQATGVDLH
ncbi:hypothetical protein GCM10020219_082270 [Nonomuraea dietziae]